MAEERFDVTIAGCAPAPLARYLKALGVLRLVSEQFDDSARGFWRGDEFVINSRASKPQLQQFFLEQYCPTPIVSPWNGGSGFFLEEEKSKEKDESGHYKKTGIRSRPNAATKVLDNVLSSATDRLAEYRKTINIAKNVLREAGFVQAPKDEEKGKLLQWLRNALPDDTIRWLDAAVVIGSERPAWPPLLGTGGNDGRGDFSSNFMQRLQDVINFTDGTPTQLSEAWLDSALFGVTKSGLLPDVLSGQFDPGATGGSNASNGFDSDSLVNPWDFILLLEGTLVFAAASAKRLAASIGYGTAAFPFSVKPIAAGFGAASSVDKKARPEMWVPVWVNHASITELTAIFAEGRAQAGNRVARNSVDFAQAIGSLGVDRGISSFQRYGFQVRNGKNYFAVPLGDFRVKRVAQADLISEFGDWLSSTRRILETNSGIRAIRAIEEGTFSLVKDGSPERVQNALISLGSCERLISRQNHSIKPGKKPVKPVPLLSPRWLRDAWDGTREFRVAAALASVYGRYPSKDANDKCGNVVPLRAQLEPIQIRSYGPSKVVWADNAIREVVWNDGNLTRSLNAIMARRIAKGVQSGHDMYSDRSKVPILLSDITEFVEGRLDERRIAELLWGLSLIDWGKVTEEDVHGMYCSDTGERPSAGYAVLKLCFAGCKIRGVKVPIVPEIHRRARAGDDVTAIKLAFRRLHASGLRPPHAGSIQIPVSQIERTAAALIFPLSSRAIEALSNRVLVKSEDGNEVHENGI